MERIRVIHVKYSRNIGTLQNISNDDNQWLQHLLLIHVGTCIILGSRRYIIFLLCLVLFSVFIGLVDAAVDAAPGAGVCVQLHGPVLSGRLRVKI